MTDREKLREVCKALDTALIGGNYLASNLIHILGAEEKNFPLKGTPFEGVRILLSDRFPDTWLEIYEQWCAWNACMQARDIAEAALGTDGWKHQ
jgi:hypothetical protein